MQSPERRDDRTQRWRFLGASASRWVIICALMVVAMWLGGVALLLIKLIHAITGAGSVCS